MTPLQECLSGFLVEGNLRSVLCVFGAELDLRQLALRVLILLPRDFELSSSELGEDLSILAFNPATDLNERPSETLNLAVKIWRRNEKIPELGSFTAVEQMVNK